jgi:uncharacterized RDD family membrane protein YckC
VLPDIASRRERIRAGVLDGLLFVPVVLLDWHVATAGWEQLPTFLYFLVSWQLGWVYTVVLHGWRGQTVGKALRCIRVVRHADRGRLGWVRAVVRESPYIALTWACSAVWVAWNLAYFFGLESDELDSWANRSLDGLIYVNLGWICLEFVTMAIHPERRAIHDLLAGSVVLKVLPVAEPHGAPDTGREIG